MSLRVLVVGGGVGGLCLAQGLRKAGVEVRVYERDPTPATRGQGYRLRIDEYGIDALAHCLPADLFALFRATTNAPYPPRGAVFDHHLDPLPPAAGDATAQGPRRPSTVADRRTLRGVLLAGLGDAVHFGHEVVGVGQTAGGVHVRFADGRTATGDVLVGADGINSVVRGHLLPHAEVFDPGLRGIYGHAILDRDLLAALPDVLFGGSSPVLGPGGVTLAVGAYRPCEPPQRAAARIAPYARLNHVADYVKWTLVGLPESFGVTERELWAAPPTRLYGIARRLTADWHPAIVALVTASDDATTFALAIRAALPVDPWPAGRITLLGDAIHATTPVGGTGANTALRDAALLAGHLADVARGHLAPVPAVGRYEARMREYGFAAATRSLRGAGQIFRVPVPALS
jgi:2-polyprenyl-6-methoxyphenol hydroxylase-like FAD-dependent oxidoreductase